ncbi:uncharacterized protein Dwil_GK17364 [Drosophila willistoni]|uniref:Uncharacterized protein n=1 Tax=Drosophila willistoni TaxID=7260 RepID=B4ML48_DROWI|nr:uncharacterized protein LOC6638606 [Drosophila willistoni]EDW73106.1 uncharacterized protein Dwil_GK17364 [Drosophila willistoni]
MKGITLFLVALGCLVATSSSAQLAPIKSVQQAAAAPAAPNFALELVAIIRSIPRKQIQHLVQAYLLNDEEFQAVVRDINSMSGYRLQQQVLRQPELRQLFIWLNQQLILAGSSIKIFEDLELEIKVFNKYPYWSQMVGGINGFENDFNFIYPLEAIRSQIEQSAQRSPLVAELWRRVVALKPLYERLLATPQAKVLVNQLQSRGVNVSAVDSFIRYQFGWSNATLPSYDYTEYLNY